MKESKTSFISQCLDILKLDSVKKEIKSIFTPIIELLLSEIYPYLYILILLFFLIFILIIITLIILIFILNNKYFLIKN
jgi:hypothetical protein